MATSPTESPPPPLFRSQSIQVSQQWPQPTFAAWYDWSGCVYTEHGRRNNLPVSLVNVCVVVECRFYVKLDHWSVGICLAKIIYVTWMLNFPVVDTYLTSGVWTGWLSQQRLNQWIETKPSWIMATVCHSYMLTFPRLVCRVSHPLIVLRR